MGVRFATVEVVVGKEGIISQTERELVLVLDNAEDGMVYAVDDADDDDSDGGYEIKS
jgi:hypothetical protein